MGLHEDYDDRHDCSDLNLDEKEGYDQVDTPEHKRRMRRMIEDRLERKRLKEELQDELEAEFDWDDYDGLD